MWIFATFNIGAVGDATYYHYFGAVRESLYQRIRDNEINSGFITLQDVRYWNDNDLIQAYEDDQDTGVLTFRIEQLVKLELEKGDPVNTYPAEQVAPESMMLRQDSDTGNQEENIY